MLRSQKNWILLVSEPLKVGGQEGVTFFGSHLAQERERRGSYCLYLGLWGCRPQVPLDSLRLFHIIQDLVDQGPQELQRSPPGLPFSTLRSPVRLSHFWSSPPTHHNSRGPSKDPSLLLVECLCLKGTRLGHLWPSVCMLANRAFSGFLPPPHSNP